MNSMFDRLAGAVPIDRAAGIAFRARGVHYEPALAETRAGWDAPPAMRPLPADAPQILGHVFGRMRVIGLLAEIKPKYARWVVRCACGRYETRRARVIFGAHAALDRCARCDHFEKLQHIDLRGRLGEARADRMREEDRAARRRAAALRGVASRRAAGLPK